MKCVSLAYLLASWVCLSIISCATTPPAPIRRLLMQTGLKDSVGLDEVITMTQTAWLRPQGSEREDLLNKALPTKAMMTEFKELGLIDEVSLGSGAFNYSLLLGGTYQDAKERVRFLEHLLLQGIKVSHVVILSSMRPLYEDEIQLIKKEFNTALPTEIAMMDFLVKKSKIATLGLKISQVVSPMKISGKTMVRANTKDTVLDFLQGGYEVGSCLVISNQPYVKRQDLVVRGLLTNPWHVVTVGPAADAGLSKALFLDELARFLYESRNYR